jgi:hypothetical protein
LAFLGKPCLLLSLLPVVAYILKDLGGLPPRLPRLRAAVRKGELEVGQHVEYLADALLAPLNVDLNYQRQIIGINGTHKLRATRARTVQIDAGC